MASVTSLSSNATSSTTGHASWTFDADTATFTVQLTGPGTNNTANLTSSSCDFTSLVPNSTYTVHLTPTSAGGVNGTTATSTFSTPSTSPATLNIVSIGQTGAQFYISNLTYLWDTTQYSDAYVIIAGVGTSAPVYAPTPPGSGYSTSFGNITGLSPGTTYTATGYIVTSANQTVNVGSVTFTTQAPPRPTNFVWTTAKVQGQNVNVSASEWASLGSKVNDFRLYKGLSTFVFTTVTAGATNISAAIYNEMRTKINDMSPPTTLPAAVVANVTDIAASHFNGLRDSLNSIP